GNYEAKGRLGEIYIAAGKFDEAVEIIEDFVKNRPKEPKGYVLNAGLLVRSGDLDGSIE
ncbi:MAG: hypothetical protein GTO08_04805, partial [Deltaproteobacteria bacterium]|nr:hypothetical protein [Deltaproteobacteria bacterium]